MSELDKGIVLDERKEVRPNPMTGEPEEWKVISGRVELSKIGEITPDALKANMETQLTRDMGKTIYHKIKETFTRLALEDMKLYTSQVNSIYETPLLGENEIILSPMKMAELRQKGSITIIVEEEQS